MYYATQCVVTIICNLFWFLNLVTVCRSPEKVHGAYHFHYPRPATGRRTARLPDHHPIPPVLHVTFYVVIILTGSSATWTSDTTFDLQHTP